MVWEPPAKGKKEALTTVRGRAAKSRIASCIVEMKLLKNPYLSFLCEEDKILRIYNFEGKGKAEVCSLYNAGKLRPRERPKVHAEYSIQERYANWLAARHSCLTPFSYLRNHGFM